MYFLNKRQRCKLLVGGGGGGVWGHTLPGRFLDSFRQDIGQFHSPQIGSNLVPKSLPFCKERALG